MEFGSYRADCPGRRARLVYKCRDQHMWGPGGQDTCRGVLPRWNVSLADWLAVLVFTLDPLPPTTYIHILTGDLEWKMELTKLTHEYRFAEDLVILRVQFPHAEISQSVSCYKMFSSSFTFTGNCRNIFQKIPLEHCQHCHPEIPPASCLIDWQQIARIW